MAKEKLTEGANDKLTRFLEAGDPDNEVATSWRAKESLRELYTYRDPDLARDHLDALISDFTDNQRPPEVQLLGRTLKSCVGRSKATDSPVCPFAIFARKS